MGSKTTARDIDLGAIPRLKEGLDLTRIEVSQEEGFLLSRVDGQVDVDGLVKLSGMRAERALELIAALCSRRLLVLGPAPGNGDRAARRAPPAGPAAAAADEDPDYDPAELDEGLDLPLEAQKRILRLYGRRDDLTLYELLGVARRAEAKEIKRAYFQVSKDFHPDSFFRKEIGPYRPKVVALFKLVSAAYERLSNPQKREAYDKTLPQEPDLREQERVERQQAQQGRDEQLRQERRRRLLKHNPLAQRKTQARRHFDDARQYRDKNDPVKAANSVRLALALDPDNAEYLALLDQVSPKAAAIRAEGEYKRGRYEESMGNDDGALVAYLAAIELNPEESRALHRAAAVMLAAGRDLKTALTFARKAQQVDPESIEVAKTTADLYYELGMHKNALREYTRYLQLNPLDERVQERIKALRKMK